MKLICLVLVIYSFACNATSVLNGHGYQAKSRIVVNAGIAEPVYFSSAFSHDNKYFAIAFAEKEMDSQVFINIYQSSTGVLKYQTKVINAEVTNGHQLAFSKNNEMVIFYGLIATHQYFWKFKHSKVVVEGCNGHMGGYVEDTSEDNKTVLYRTFGDSYGSLCESDTIAKTLSFEEIDRTIQLAASEEKVRTYRKVLYQNKIIVPFSYVEGKSNAEIKIPNSIARDVELWNIDFLLSQKEDRHLSLSMVDFENKVIMLYDPAPDKTIVHQWSYADKVRLQSFKLDFCVKYYSSYMMTSRYLFLETCDGEAVLLEREGHAFFKKVHFKHFRSNLVGKSSLEREALPQFLEKYLVFSNVPLIGNDTDRYEYFRVHLTTGQVNRWEIDGKVELIEPLNDEGTLLVAQKKRNGNYNDVIFDVESGEVVANLSRFIAISNNKKTLVTHDKGFLTFWSKFQNL